MDHQDFDKFPENTAGDTVSFESRASRPAASPGSDHPSGHQQDPGQKPRRRRKRIPQRIYRRGRLGAFFYVTATLAVCVAFALFFLSAFNDVLAFNKPNRAIEITIPKGATTEDIAAILKNEGLIEHDAVFTYVSRFEKEYEGKYQPGTHVLNTNMGYTTMMKTMSQKNDMRETVTVTIPEGLPLQKIADILEENNVCDAQTFLEKIAGTNFGYSFEDQIPKNGKIFYPLEGYLFPDTYEFYKNDSELNVIRRMMGNFDKKITPEMMAQMKKRGLTLHETLTFASIVQAEATGDEMKKVASVYWNRLNNPDVFPKLQADPTRDYANEQILATRDEHDRTLADAYNTYVSPGLPPGPINNPGFEAIMAVLEPVDTPYFYFCTDTRTKEFYYAETLEEHNENVRKAGLRGWK